MTRRQRVGGRAPRRHLDWRGSRARLSSAHHRWNATSTFRPRH